MPLGLLSALPVLITHSSQEQTGTVCCCVSIRQQHAHKARSRMQLSIAVPSTRMPAFFLKTSDVRTVPLRKKHPLSSNVFLRTENPRMKISSLPAKKVYLNAVSLFYFDAADRKEALAACAKTPARRGLCAFEKQLSLEKAVVPSVQVAKKNPSPSTPRNFC